MSRLSALLVLAIACTASGAAPPLQPTSQPGDLALTIYSTADPASFNPREALQSEPAPPRLPGFGIVREVRRIDLQSGINTVEFSGLADGIDPTTLRLKSLTAPRNTAILEQTYRFDLDNPEKLLRKYIGKPILINRKPAANDRAPDTKEGVLLTFDGQQFVIQTKNRQMPIEVIPRNQDITEVKLFNMDLAATPTVTAKARTDAPGTHSIEVMYATQGLTWRADYNLVLNTDSTSAELGAWASILNQSGASYPDAKLKLVAGDVNRAQPEIVGGRTAVYLGARVEWGFARSELAEYHEYTLAGTATLPNSALKQMELFPRKADVGVERTYVYHGSPLGDGPRPLADRPITEPGFGQGENTTVSVVLKLSNTDKAGLGVPLPAGRVRVYKSGEADAAPQFIGEDTIRHTPVNEPLSIRIGSAFDIVGQRKQTDFSFDSAAKTMTESFKITLSNHKDQPVKVFVKEPLARAVQWQITQKSTDYEKLSAHMIQFAVEVPANGQKTVTYTVKYSW